MIYTEEFRNEALSLAEKIGIRKASKELHVGEQTLYKWKKDRREKKAAEAGIEETAAVPPASSLNYMQELEEERKINKSCQQTIEYLVEENRALRQQCDNYLAAIRLITQR